MSSCAQTQCLEVAYSSAFTPPIRTTWPLTSCSLSTGDGGEHNDASARAASFATPASQWLGSSEQVGEYLCGAVTSCENNTSTCCTPKFSRTMKTSCRMGVHDGNFAPEFEGKGNRRRWTKALAQDTSGCPPLVLVRPVKIGISYGHVSHSHFFCMRSFACSHGRILQGGERTCSVSFE
jgi:hypothetical protein